jgi:hypothetical protein
MVTASDAPLHDQVVAHDRLDRRRHDHDGDEHPVAPCRPGGSATRGSAQ